jgi:hypothetical protein
MSKLAQLIVQAQAMESDYGASRLSPKAAEKFQRRVDAWRREVTRHASRRIKRQERPLFDD